jgi:hypothetical protein
MRDEPIQVPTTRIRPPDDDDGDPLSGSERQRRHWPKKTVFVERVHRSHEIENSTTRWGVSLFAIE